LHAPGVGEVQQPVNGEGVSPVAVLRVEEAEAFGAGGFAELFPLILVADRDFAALG
jgi:hypothetical protein